MNKHTLKSVKYAHLWADVKKGRNWTPMHVDELLEILGFPNHRLPDEGMEPRQVQGVWVWVEPKATKTQFIRTMCQCPGCDRVLTVKNLGQHICKPEAVQRKTDLILGRIS